jgi:hypothetical protein
MAAKDGKGAKPTKPKTSDTKASVVKGSVVKGSVVKGARAKTGSTKSGRTKAGVARRHQTSTDGRQSFRHVPPSTHEWISFEDPDELRTWVFDVTFLLSNWHCIYGRGCQGVLTGPAPELVQGCCSYGAHFTDGADVTRVKAAARTLTPHDWQFAAAGRRGVVQRQADGTRTTRLVDDACIFLNRPGFPGGPGCALHRAALARAEEPMALKPDVCWQLPLRREDTVGADGRVTSTITQWNREHWGEGGEEFHWWCTEAPEAFTSSQHVYQTMRPELTAMVGAGIYSQLAAYLEARLTSGTPLPHPVLRAGR